MILPKGKSSLTVIAITSVWNVLIWIHVLGHVLDDGPSGLSQFYDSTQCIIKKLEVYYLYTLPAFLMKHPRQLRVIKILKFMFKNYI